MSPFNPEDIAQLPKARISTLYPQPNYEIFEFRFDILRQTESNSDGDGNSSTDDVDYHVAGYNLGGGLFWDLNDNFSFRLDYLLAIEPINGGSVLYEAKTNNLTNKSIRYQWDQLQFFRYRTRRRNRPAPYLRYSHRSDKIILQMGNSVNNYNRDTLFFNEQDGLRFPRDWGGYWVLHRTAQNEWKHERSKPTKLSRQHTVLQGNDTLFLGQNYLLIQSDDQQRLELYRRRAFVRGYMLLKTLEKLPNGWLVYDNNYNGYTLINDNLRNYVMITYNNGRIEQYKVEDAPPVSRSKLR